MAVRFEIQPEGDTETWTSVALLEAATDLILKAVLVRTGDRLALDRARSHITGWADRHGYVLVPA